MTARTHIDKSQEIDSELLVTLENMKLVCEKDGGVLAKVLLGYHINPALAKAKRI